MRESTIEAYLVKRVNECGGEVRKMKWIGRRSAPDRLLLLPYFHPLIELKATGEAPRADQEREHERLRRAGLIVVVIDSKQGVDELLDKALAISRRMQLLCDEVLGNA